MIEFHSGLHSQWLGSDEALRISHWLAAGLVTRATVVCIGETLSPWGFVAYAVYMEAAEDERPPAIRA